MHRSRGSAVFAKQASLAATAVMRTVRRNDANMNPYKTPEGTNQLSISNNANCSVVRFVLTTLTIAVLSTLICGGIALALTAGSTNGIGLFLYWANLYSVPIYAFSLSWIGFRKFRTKLRIGLSIASAVIGPVFFFVVVMIFFTSLGNST